MPGRRRWRRRHRSCRGATSWRRSPSVPVPRSVGCSPWSARRWRSLHHPKEARMMRRTLFAALTAAILIGVGAACVDAAPEGKVVIAQGVDPTTLDTMNQQETPASVVTGHIFDGLVERDSNLKVVPALASELPKLVAPTTWEVKLRKGA